MAVTFPFADKFSILYTTDGKNPPLRNDHGPLMIPKLPLAKTSMFFFQVLILAFCIPGTKASQIFHCEDMFSSDNGHSDVK